jgi:hypothetical protein
MNAFDPVSRRSFALWIAAGVVLVATVTALKLEGRIWWCACGQAFLWAGDVQSQHCSQHLLDAYAFTHVLHGVGFYAVLALLFSRQPPAWRFFTILALEAAWEILENSPIIINRYRTHTAALGYEGDSIANALGDIAACMAGAWFVRWAGWKWSLALWITLEALLVFWIRDNLFLNIFMLLIPSEGLKAWQSGG